MVRKKLQFIYKFIVSKLFQIIYGKIVFLNQNDNDVKLKEVNKDENNYKFIEINNGRIFTDYVEHVAIINKNQIMDFVSYQQVKGVFKDPTFNVVIKKGTPKFKKKFNGKVFSLVQGASGNNNYFHWMFDILPRLIILEKYYNLNDRMVGVSGISGDPAYPKIKNLLPPLDIGYSGSLLAKAFNKLGWHWWPSYSAIKKSKKFS